MPSLYKVIGAIASSAQLERVLEMNHLMFVQGISCFPKMQHFSSAVVLTMRLSTTQSPSHLEPLLRKHVRDIQIEGDSIEIPLIPHHLPDQPSQPIRPINQV